MSPRSQALSQKAHYWRWIYISWDFAGGWLAYTSLYLLRKSVLEPARFGLQSMQWDSFYTVGAFLTGLIWVCVFGIVGLYERLNCG